MSFGTYRQYDSRWGKKNYNGSSTYSQAGCGATACANILYALNPKITPLTTGNFMKSHGYAIRNQGTAWNGIPACLKHFGATDVRQVDKMADVYSLMSKGYVGVFLFRAGTRGGITWTSSGHYIAVTGYKHANGKHYFKTFDSGGRKHDGWYCYETNMKGLIPRIWLCKVTLKKPTGKYGGEIPKPTLKKGSKGDSVAQLQKFLKWYGISIKPDGDFGNATDSALRIFQKTEGIEPDGVYGSQSYNKACNYRPKQPVEPTETKPTTNADKIVAKIKEYAWAKGTPKKKWAYKTGKPKEKCKKAMAKHGYKTKEKLSSCIYFANTVVRDSGVNKKFCAGHGHNKPYPKTEKGFDTVLKGKFPSDSFLKAGDLIRYKTKKDEHAMFYIGNGLIADAGHYNRFANIRKNDHRYKRDNVKKSTLQVLRPKE